MQSNWKGMQRAVLVCMFATSSLLTAQPQPGTPQPRAGADDTRKGIVDGEAAAQSVGTGDWMFRGAAFGVVPFAGAAVVRAMAAKSDMSVPADHRLRIAEQGAAYQVAYEYAYTSKRVSNRDKAILKGTGIGTIIFVLYQNREKLVKW